MYFYMKRFAVVIFVFLLPYFTAPVSAAGSAIAAGSNAPAGPAGVAGGSGAFLQQGFVRCQQRCGRAQVLSGAGHQ